MNLSRGSCTYKDRTNCARSFLDFGIKNIPMRCRCIDSPLYWSGWDHVLFILSFIWQAIQSYRTGGHSREQPFRFKPRKTSHGTPESVERRARRDAHRSSERVSGPGMTGQGSELAGRYGVVGSNDQRSPHERGEVHEVERLERSVDRFDETAWKHTVLWCRGQDRT